ncbi:MAG TPA: hypothetical protein ENK82_02900 [Campylobacterales bacterium]|nr:hypothetical protein [Campylobacterales bacterium]HHS92268.1 hypothetical protein [Campylobacterales bacterium]
MESIVRSKIVLTALLCFGFTSYLLAEPKLPVSQQVTEKTSKKPKKEEKIEIVPEIKIEAQASTGATNSNLKQGDACDDENLEEVQGELFTDIPMAETIPCDTVDCKDLKPAKMHKDNYVPLKTAKTISCKK